MVPHYHKYWEYPDIQSGMSFNSPDKPKLDCRRKSGVLVIYNFTLRRVVQSIPVDYTVTVTLLESRNEDLICQWIGPISGITNY